MLVGVVIAIAGCGRLGFDRTVDGSITGDDGPPADDMAPVDAAAALSCTGLAPTCGPTRATNCCDSSIVSGGVSFRSHDTADAAYPSTMYPATVSDFRLDRYELTVGRFRGFVAAGQGTSASPPAAGAGAHPRLPTSGWDPSWNAELPVDTPALMTSLRCGTVQTWTDAVGANEDRPLGCISWYLAMAFCAWDGGFLPTEAEWNYAASGGSEQRAYPWSSPATPLLLDSSHASYFVDATKQCFGDGINGCAVTDLVVVGSKPAGDGRWGHADLAGNVFEWVLDSYAANYVNPCNDCADLTPGQFRVGRGGGFRVDATFLRTARRNGANPIDRLDDVGTRCARATGI